MGMFIAGRLVAASTPTEVLLDHWTGISLMGPMPVTLLYNSAAEIAHLQPGDQILFSERPWVRISCQINYRLV